MIRTRVRDPGAELIVDTPKMANNEKQQGGGVPFATAGIYNGEFQVYVEFEGHNDLGVSSVTHRSDRSGDWSRAEITLGANSEQMIHIDPDGQPAASTYAGIYGVERLGVSDSRIPSFISPESLALDAAMQSPEEL